MNTTLDDGGPAFPGQHFTNANGDTQFAPEGMFLRDWFAGMALQGILANKAMIDTATPCSAEWVAEFSHQCADAMIAARKEAK